MSDFLTVYLVDDDKDDRLFFKEALSELPERSEIILFSNGVDLMADLLEDSGKLPDILFIDLNMPLMNGEECITDIRAEKKFDDIPIVVYSTVCDEEQLQNLNELGANGYLEKPNIFSELKRKLGSALNHLARQKKVKITSELIIIP